MFDGQCPDSLLSEVGMLKSVIYGLGEGVIVADRQGRFLFFNRVAEEVLGIGDGVLEQWSDAFGCYRPDGVTLSPAADLPLARALCGERVPETEIFIRNRVRPKGVWIRAKADPLWDEDDQLLGGVVVFQDVTLKKEGLERIQMLTSAVEQTADSVLITDRDGVIGYVNPAFEQTTGYTLGEVLGQTPRLLKSGKHSPDFYRGLWTTITSGQPFREVVTNRKKSGELFLAEQTITPIKDPESKIIHFVSVIKDVTEQRIAEEQISQMALARTVQQRFYSVRPPQVTGFDIAGSAFPADATGGDYFDFISLPDGRLAIAVGDVSGHGISSALLMAELRASVRASALTIADPGEIFRLVNAALVSDLARNEYATLIMCRLHPLQRSLVYASAGHVSGFILTPEGTIKRVLESTGLPLGMFADAKSTCSEEIPIESDETLVLLTDGITEAEDTGYTEYGIDRTLEYIRGHRSDNACDIVSGLVEAVREFMGDSPQHDDLTVVICKSTVKVGCVSQAAL